MTGYRTPAGELGAEHDPDGLRERAQSRLEGGQPEPVLEEQGAGEQHAEEGNGAQRDHSCAAAEQAVLEQADVDQRLRVAVLDRDQRRQHQRPAVMDPTTNGLAPRLERAFRDPVHQKGQATGGEHETRDVKGPGPGGFVAAQEEQAEHPGRHTDRDVDEEHPPPRQLGHEQAAEDRPESRRHRGGDDEDAGCPDPLGRGERPEQQGHANRHHEPAAEALDDAEGDELAETLSAAAEGGRAREHDYGDEKHAPGPEPVAQPARRGNEDRQAHQVTDGDGVDGVGPYVELASDGRQGHVDDRHVHDVHEHGGDEDDAYCDLLVESGAEHC